MSRTEQAVRSDRPSNLALLERLDANVKAKAKRVVSEALNPHERQILETLAAALTTVAGNAVVHDIRQRVSDAFRLIQQDAERAAYTKLVDETIHAISDGKPVDLT